MKGKVLGAILGATGLISLASLGAILLFIPPETEPFLVPALFSLALFLALASIFTFTGRRLRRRYETPASQERILTISFREAIIAAAMLLVLLWLNRLDWLNIWAAVGVVAAAVILEYFFLVRQTRSGKLPANR